MQGSVLVVDRDDAMRKLITGNFGNAGYRVSCASDLSGAEAVLRTAKPDVALLDWDPGSPGPTFARQLRADPRTAPMSIVMLGRRSDERDTILALESGADDYIRKPVSMLELLARVKAVLRRRAPELCEDSLEIDGLRLDPAARRVSAGESDIALRNTEFRLLHFLMTHPRRTYSRRELLDHVWGENVFIEERTVDVHVRRLRRALDRTHGALIETVRGVGYKLGATPGPTRSHWGIADLMSERFGAEPAAAGYAA
jgi:two-component system phosphate regulon response regulator PhoB